MLYDLADNDRETGEGLSVGTCAYAEALEKIKAKNYP